VAQINNILTEIKQHILGCFAFLDCGFENVRQLLDAVKGNDPQGFREYEHVLFDDRLGNYFWIEKTSDVSITRKNNGILGTCEGAYHEARQRFSLFCMVAAAKEEQLFECLAGCLANYGCTVTISGGDYDSIAVVRKELGDVEGLNDILSNLANYAIVRLDFSLIYDLLPTNYGIENCDCEPCNDCGDNLPTEIIPPPCSISVTGLTVEETAPGTLILHIDYASTGTESVGLNIVYEEVEYSYPCQKNEGGYYDPGDLSLLQTGGITATLIASNDDCETICSSSKFITIADTGIVTRKGGVVQFPPPNEIPTCSGVIGYVQLYVDKIVGASINPNTGVVAVPAQIINGQGYFVYYVTCNGVVTAIVRLVLENQNVIIIP